MVRGASRHPRRQRLAGARRASLGPKLLCPLALRSDPRDDVTRRPKGCTQGVYTREKEKKRKKPNGSKEANKREGWHSRMAGASGTGTPRRRRARGPRRCCVQARRPARLWWRPRPTGPARSRCCRRRTAPCRPRCGRRSPRASRRSPARRDRRRRRQQQQYQRASVRARSTPPRAWPGACVHARSPRAPRPVPRAWDALDAGAALRLSLRPESGPTLAGGTMRTAAGAVGHREWC